MQPPRRSIHFRRRADRDAAQPLPPALPQLPVHLQRQLSCYTLLMHKLPHVCFRTRCSDPFDQVGSLTPSCNQNRRSYNTMSNLIIHHPDWPFERVKFDPINPGEVPSETSQWVEYTDAEEQRCRVRYVVRSKWLTAESKLCIEYRAEDQKHLPEGWPSAENVEFWGWGIHILTIEPGKELGPSTWQDAPYLEPVDGPGWRLEAISGGTANRRRGTIWAIQRGQQGHFRQSLLAMDGCCALTREICETALEAAHIVPARQEGPENPENGMLLRADIHRLFDAGKFQICPETGKVLVEADFDYPSCILQEAQVPEGVLERIRTALRKRGRLPAR